MDVYARASLTTVCNFPGANCGLKCNPRDVQRVFCTYTVVSQHLLVSRVTAFPLTTHRVWCEYLRDSSF